MIDFIPNEAQRLAETVDIVADALRVHARAQANRGHATPSEDWILDAARNITNSLIGTFYAIAADAEAETITTIGQLAADKPDSQT